MLFTSAMLTLSNTDANKTSVVFFVDSNDISFELDDDADSKDNEASDEGGDVGDTFTRDMLVSLMYISLIPIPFKTSSSSSQSLSLSSSLLCSSSLLQF